MEERRDPFAAAASSLEQGVLTIRLPEHMDGTNRQGVLKAAEQAGSFVRLRLDASATRSMDGAAIGMLARVVRLARDTTGQAPALLHPSDSIRGLLRAAMLLHFFEVVEAE